MKIQLFKSPRTVTATARLTRALVLASLWIMRHPGTAQTVPTGQLARDGVTLNLTQVRAEHLDQDVLFECDATLFNHTQTTLHVKSNFASAFDGLELVVCDEQGKRLAQQPYIWHQSPQSFLNTRAFDLKPGANRHPLAFPIRDLPRQLKNLRVLLVGTLPGSTYEGVLCSGVVAVSITAGRGH